MEELQSPPGSQVQVTGAEDQGTLERSTRPFYSPSSRCFHERSTRFHRTHCNRCHPVVLPRCPWWSCWGGGCQVLLVSHLACYSTAGTAEAAVVLASGGCRGFLSGLCVSFVAYSSRTTGCQGGKWWSRSSNVETNNV